MKVLSINSTDQTPEVHSGKGKEIFSFEGRSISDESSSFYKPAIQCIVDYKNGLNSTTCFKFKFDYIDTPSSKIIFNIITLAGQIEDGSVIRCFKTGEERIEKIGEEFSKLVQMPFEIKSYRSHR